MTSWSPTCFIPRKLWIFLPLTSWALGLQACATTLFRLCYGLNSGPYENGASTLPYGTTVGPSADPAGLLCPVDFGKPLGLLSIQPDPEKGGHFLPTEQAHLWRRKSRDCSIPDPRQWYSAEGPWEWMGVTSSYN